MIRHPDSGAIRAALDGERPDVRAHVHDCASCQRRSDELAAGAAIAADAFAEPVPTTDLDVDAALARLRSEQVVVPLRRREPRRWTALGRVAAVTLVVAVVGGALTTPSGRAAATSFLESFRSERIAVVPLDMASIDPTALRALADVAEIEGNADLIEPQEVPDVAAAAAVAGFSVAPLDVGALPKGANGPVHVLAQAPQTVRITFPDHANVPPNLRDAVLVLDLPGAIVQAVEGVNDMPAVASGEAGLLQIRVEGDATLAEVRDGLLSLPGLPAETVKALREIEDWETTLPLPIPVDRIAWQETKVDGHAGVAFGDETGLGAALLWRDGDRFVGVAGRLPLSQVRQLAEAE